MLNDYKRFGRWRGWLYGSLHGFVAVEIAMNSVDGAIAPMHCY